jgi:hypothetical protein
MTSETVKILVDRVNNGNFVSGRLNNGYLATALVSQEDAQRLLRQLATRELGEDKLSRGVEAEVRIDQLIGIERGD